MTPSVIRDFSLRPWVLLGITVIIKLTEQLFGSRRLSPALLGQQGDQIQPCIGWPHVPHYQGPPLLPVDQNVFQKLQASWKQLETPLSDVLQGVNYVDQDQPWISSWVLSCLDWGQWWQPYQTSGKDFIGTHMDSAKPSRDLIFLVWHSAELDSKTSAILGLVCQFFEHHGDYRCMVSLLLQYPVEKNKWGFALEGTLESPVSANLRLQVYFLAGQWPLLFAQYLFLGDSRSVADHVASGA